MTLIQALLLGIIQGITEFLPISSSGHLALAQYFFGFDNLHHYLMFDLICHGGTLCAIFFVYFHEIKQLSTAKFKQIILGTLPLFFVLPLLKLIEDLYDKPQLLGYFFLCTSLILFLGIYGGCEKPLSEKNKNRWKDSFLIGIFQAIALIPGISRSGSTISGARLLGWNQQEAVTFSFLLAIPAIIGGTVLKVGEFIFFPSQGIALSCCFVGFLSSFASGYCALLLLIKLASKEKFLYFVWYCLLLGIGAIWLFLNQ